MVVNQIKYSFKRIKKNKKGKNPKNPGNSSINNNNKAFGYRLTPVFRRRLDGLRVYVYTLLLSNCYLGISYKILKKLKKYKQTKALDKFINIRFTVFLRAKSFKNDISGV